MENSIMDNVNYMASFKFHEKQEREQKYVSRKLMKTKTWQINATTTKYIIVIENEPSKIINDNSEIQGTSDKPFTCPQKYSPVRNEDCLWWYWKLEFDTAFLSQSSVFVCLTELINGRIKQ